MRKKCKVCKKTKLVRQFYAHASCKYGVRPECKECENKVSKVRSRKYALAYPEKRRSTVLKNKYGITFDQYRRMLGAQGNGCGICGSFNPGASKKYFSVDHNHKTGKTRGLLCHDCNAGLGMFKDDPISLKSAINYLEHHNG